MREIKFRLWDFKEEIMIDGDSLAFEEYLPITQLLSQKGIMQYTGLKDKNDVEIYEGDIVGCESNGINRYEHRVVCYDSHQTRYKCVPFVAYHQNAGNGGWTGYELKYHNEVIGNIYTHPHLLGSEKE